MRKHAVFRSRTRFLMSTVGLFMCIVVAFRADNALAELPTNLATIKFGQDWPKFLGPDGDSKSNETGIVKDWSGDGLKVVWQLPLQQSYGAPSVSRGRLFQFDSEPVGRGKNVGKLICLHAETGKALWTYKYDYEYRDQYGYNNGPRCSPLVDGERVYLYGVDGRLICLNVSDGSEVWAVEASSKYNVVQNFFGVGSNPVIYGDLIIAMVGGSPHGTRRLDLARGDGTGIVAFNKLTGAEVYRLSDELASYASLRLIKGKRDWCFAFLRGGLVAFNPKDGKQDFAFPWRAPILESVNASVPVVIDDHVFISETYGPGSAMLNFAAHEPGEDGPEVVWQDRRRSRDKSMQTHWNTAIHHKGYLYGSSGRHEYNAELRCIDASTGKVMWTEPGLSRSSLLYVDDHFVCLSETGELLLIEATPREFRKVTSTIPRAGGANGKALLKPPAWAAPVLSHGLLYVRGDDRLVCLQLISRK